MRFLGNILWFIIGGFIDTVVWFAAGLFMCVTIIGIPVGVQCFKFAKLSLAPFGKEIVYSSSVFSLFVNILWLILFGLEMALADVVIGLILCVTIIGIPFGIQHFKFAKLDLMPFGAKIVKA